MTSGLVTIGRVVKTQGLKGELRVLPFAESPDRFLALEGCYVLSPDAPDAGEFRRLESVRFQGGVPILKLEGADEITEASGLVGRLLAVKEEEVRPLPNGEFYVWQLLGCRVVTEDGREVGVLSDVESGPSQDLWVVRHAHGEHLVPAVTEIIIRVDLSAKEIIIRPPDGLLDL
jgi:16S rRNA processing protein RimM